MGEHSLDESGYKAMITNPSASSPPFFKKIYLFERERESMSGRARGREYLSQILH